MHLQSSSRYVRLSDERQSHGVSGAAAARASSQAWIRQIGDGTTVSSIRLRVPVSRDVHERGINMRHIGLLRSLITVDHDARHVLLIEIVARTLKNLLRAWQRSTLGAAAADSAPPLPLRLLSSASSLAASGTTMSGDSDVLVDELKGSFDHSNVHAFGHLTSILSRQASSAAARTASASSSDSKRQSAAVWIINV